MSGVQSICHPFATVIFKIAIEQRNSTEHAELIALSVLLVIYEVLMLVISSNSCVLSNRQKEYEEFWRRVKQADDDSGQRYGAVKILILMGRMISAYRSGKGITELKNQIIPLAYYARLTHEQIEGLKKKHNVK